MSRIPRARACAKATRGTPGGEDCVPARDGLPSTILELPRWGKNDFEAEKARDGWEKAGQVEQVENVLIVVLAESPDASRSSALA